MVVPRSHSASGREQGRSASSGRVLWANDWVALGEDRIGPGDPDWGSEAEIGARPVIAFSSSAFGLRTRRGEVVVDSNRILFGNPRNVYRRRLLSAHGQRTHWLAIDESQVYEILERQQQRVGERAPFPWIDAAASASTYLRQCRLFSRLELSEPMAIEEEVLELADEAVRAGIRTAPPREPHEASATRRRHAELVREAQTLLTRRMGARLTLREVARRLQTSPYHLARLFRRTTSFGLHEYLTQVRLRAALARLPDAQGDITRVALEVGFSSHSHFTAAFRASFGTRPSQIGHAHFDDVRRRLPGH